MALPYSAGAAWTEASSAARKSLNPPTARAERRALVVTQGSPRRAMTNPAAANCRTNATSSPQASF